MGPQPKPLETYNYNRDEINQIAVSSKGFLAAADDSGDVKIVNTIQKCLYKRLREPTQVFAAVYNSFLGDLGQQSLVALTRSSLHGISPKGEHYFLLITDHLNCKMAVLLAVQGNVSTLLLFIR
uniref:Uncharacterized protein n=1 Tax=Setaria viridis TaxID=4556 RepID=A0A4U6USP0_SETVI|nr:hypothetical protein SEVIR_5G142451v2 [Setaria viridis]